MSTGEVRKVSPQDLQLVQNLIERCLQLYMNQKEVVSTLLHQAKIEPSFTELVWQKLEEENQEFFKAYHLRLIVKDQIIKFNKLLQTQVELMREISPSGAASIPMSNGSHISLIHQNSTCYATENTGHATKPENMHRSPVASLPNAFSNGGSSLHPCMQTAIDMSDQSRRNNVSPNLLLARSTNVGMLQGMNGEVIKSEAGYTGGFPFMYGADGNGVERRPAIGEAPVSSFNGEESNGKPLHETFVDADTSSFGFLGQIPRNFSLSDLTADFSVSSDILESYSRSPFLATDTDGFLNPHHRGEHEGDLKRLDTISEGLSYEGFGSD